MGENIFYSLILFSTLCEVIIRFSQSVEYRSCEYFGDYTQLLYLRARNYAPDMGRFVTRDSWMGDTSRPSTLNRWGYVQGNPINLIDPTGMFSREVIFNNIGLDEFEHLKYPSLLNHGATRYRYGFLALLLDAENQDLVSLGYLHLQVPKPFIGYDQGHRIWENCGTIYVDGLTLKTFYETQVKRQREHSIWWRDTSVSYYQRVTKGGMMTYIDGDYSSDLPHFHSIDLGLVFVNADLIVDMDGNFYFSVAGGAGESYGLNYTESYICSNLECDMTTSNVKELIKGYCLYGGGQIGGGYQLSICGFLNPANTISINTFSTGFGIAYTWIGVSYTWPIDFMLHPNPSLGWRAAIDARLNGIHRSDVPLYSDINYP